jgi:hypothetical protein
MHGASLPAVSGMAPARRHRCHSPVSKRTRNHLSLFVPFHLRSTRKGTYDRRHPLPLQYIIRLIVHCEFDTHDTYGSL